MLNRMKTSLLRNPRDLSSSRSPSPLDDSDLVVVGCGVFHKRGSLVKTWKQRKYHIYSNGVLYYFTMNAQSKTPLNSNGSFDCNNCIIEDNDIHHIERFKHFIAIKITQKPLEEVHIWYVKPKPLPELALVFETVNELCQFLLCVNQAAFNTNVKEYLYNKSMFTSGLNSHLTTGTTTIYLSIFKSFYDLCNLTTANIDANMQTKLSNFKMTQLQAMNTTYLANVSTNQASKRLKTQSKDEDERREDMNEAFNDSFGEMKESVFASPEDSSDFIATDEVIHVSTDEVIQSASTEDVRVDDDVDVKRESIQITETMTGIESSDVDDDISRLDGVETVKEESIVNTHETMTMTEDVRVDVDDEVDVKRELIQNTDMTTTMIMTEASVGDNVDIEGLDRGKTVKEDTLEITDVTMTATEDVRVNDDIEVLDRGKTVKEDTLEITDETMTTAMTISWSLSPRGDGGETRDDMTATQSVVLSNDELTNTNTDETVGRSDGVCVADSYESPLTEDEDLGPQDITDEVVLASGDQSIDSRGVLASGDQSIDSEGGNDDEETATQSSDVSVDEDEGEEDSVGLNQAIDEVSRHGDDNTEDCNEDTKEERQRPSTVASAVNDTTTRRHEDATEASTVTGEGSISSDSMQSSESKDLSLMSSHNQLTSISLQHDDVEVLREEVCVQETSDDHNIIDEDDENEDRREDERIEGRREDENKREDEDRREDEEEKREDEDRRENEGIEDRRDDEEEKREDEEDRRDDENEDRREDEGIENKREDEDEDKREDEGIEDRREDEEDRREDEGIEDRGEDEEKGSIVRVQELKVDEVEHDDSHDVSISSEFKASSDDAEVRTTSSSLNPERSHEMRASSSTSAHGKPSTMNDRVDDDVDGIEIPSLSPVPVPVHQSSRSSLAIEALEDKRTIHKKSFICCCAVQ